jgi:hypothetical protein
MSSEENQRPFGLAVHHGALPLPGMRHGHVHELVSLGELLLIYII